MTTISPGTCGDCYQSTDGDIRHELRLAGHNEVEVLCLWPCGHPVCRSDDHECPFHPQDEDA